MIHCYQVNNIREWMGSGVPSGLQNQYEELRASWVGSIPTLSRQNKLNIKINIIAGLVKVNLLKKRGIGSCEDSIRKPLNLPNLQ